MNIMNINIKEKIREYRRVLRISRKPGKEEFLTSTKICALGIVLIGIVGFLIFLIAVLVPNLLGLPGV